MIVEPIIKNDPQVFGYKKGRKEQIFIKDSQLDKPYIGDQWPGKSLWIDYFNPDSKKFLSFALNHLNSTIHINGIWLDMNEMANNCDNHCEVSKLSKSIPYNIPSTALENKGLPLTTLHYNNVADYHLHNLNSLKQV